MSTTGTQFNDGQADWQDDGFIISNEVAQGAGAASEPTFVLASEPGVVVTGEELVFDDPAVRDCTDTLVPLIERAAVTSESLRESCGIAGPAEKSLRHTLHEVAALLDRAEVILPRLERGVESVGAAVVSEGVGAQEGSNEGVVMDRAAIDAAIEQAIGEGVSRTMAVWERETMQLMELFRARVDRAISSIEAAASERARQLDDLCGRADRIFAQAGGDPASLTGVVGELVESMKPWRGLLIEGKCGPDLAPLVQTIVERVRADIRGGLVGRLDELDATVSRVSARTAEDPKAEFADRGWDLAGDPVLSAVGEVQELAAPSAKVLRVGPSGINSASVRAGARVAKSNRDAGKIAACPASKAAVVRKSPARSSKAAKRRAA